MKHIRIFEEWQAVNEIGDASAKAFNWKEMNNISRGVKKLGDKVLKMEIGEYMNDRFMYMFENSEGQKYRVFFDGWIQRVDPGFRFDIPGTKSKNNEDQYDSSFTLAFDTEEGYVSYNQDDKELDTNRGETFRIMSTVTEIAFDFLEKAEKSGYPVKTVTFTGKGDDGGADGIETTKRGRMYLMYVKKQLKNLKTKKAYTAMKRRLKGPDGQYSDGVTVQRGKWTGGSVIK